jgi:hypothetical protein
MKLMSPWRYSSHVLGAVACATAVKPSMLNTGSSTPGVGEANSTNSKAHQAHGVVKQIGHLISRYVALLNPDRLGLGVRAISYVTLVTPW